MEMLKKKRLKKSTVHDRLIIHKMMYFQYKYKCIYKIVIGSSSGNCSIYKKSIVGKITQYVFVFICTIV